MRVDSFAPAKVNLALHVVGRRTDGYHLLDSLVAFVAVGDRLSLRAAPETRLSVVGPRAEGVPTGPENLALRAAAMAAPGQGVAITLDKRLPAEAGIGGGSADAAAVLRAVAVLLGRPRLGAETAVALGADVPVCLSSGAQRMEGIGERLTALPPLPPVWAVLVNPGVPVPTGAVFAALACRENPGLPPELPRWREAAELGQWLTAQRNDLQPPAIAAVPAVAEVLAALRAQPGCLAARMSGSGASCFGLFPRPAHADAAVAAIVRDAPRAWWVAGGPVLAPVRPADQVRRATT